MKDTLFGFIGLGNMGCGMARNIAAKGHAMIVHDLAGTADRAPQGATIAQSNSEVARRASVVAISLPTMAANRAVVVEIAQVGNKGSVVVDTCTIGAEAAAENARILAAAGIGYVDSPVSGMKVKADAGTLASMAACSAENLQKARALIEGYSGALYHVGTEPGQGQVMKIVNNALYISALVTTSEAMSFGADSGLNMSTMLDVINASSGRNAVTSIIFPDCVASGVFDGAGAEAHIVKKDLSLFVDAASAQGTESAAIAKAYETIAAFSDANPLRDMAGIYPFVRDLPKTP
ncbi:MAG: 3-hydroxyisobutyrate dehydrogenase [Gammaproteobacteria bacterium]|jgi:3-hydroxyisobutyrate dehydrogenase